MKTAFRKTGMVLIILLMAAVVVTGCDANNNNNSDEAQPAEETEEAAQQSIMQEDLVYENNFMSGIDMEVFWEFDEEQENLNMRLESPSAGWIAVGFEPSTRMADAQIIIGGFEEDDVLAVEEHIGTGATSHEQIEESYIDEYAGERDDEYTVIEFVIPLGEETRYDLTAGEEYEVILAYHDESDNFVQRHTQRTSENIEF